MSERRMVVEQDKRFSESCLWQLQREYFDKEGIDAWVNQVPFYVTSNPFIANCYAYLVIEFVRDWARLHPETKHLPFYIMELGTGSGRFSFYVLKKLQEYRQELAHAGISIHYIMSDFTINNIKYWDSHEKLRPFVEEGVLDFASYNLENDEPITLIKKGITLTPEALSNPLIVFGNYIFDTVSQDTFTVKEGKIYESLLTMATDKENMRGGKPVDWERVNMEHKTGIEADSYYNDPHLDSVLREYRDGLKDSSFLFPIGGLRAIKKLRKLANDRIFLISSDKGYSELYELDHLEPPTPAFHGSFSMMVNFHAIARYFKHSGGDYVLQSARKGIKSAVFCSGFDLKNMWGTARAIAQHVEGFSPADYFTLHRRISDTYPECNLDVLASHMELADWDPHIYQRLNGRICSIVEESDITTVDFLANNMHRILANYYFMPKSDNIAFELALFFHSAKRYQQALDYYQKSEAYTSKPFSLVYNKALCQYHLGQRTEALENFKAALQLDPNSKEAAEWIGFIENSSTSTMR